VCCFGFILSDPPPPPPSGAIEHRMEGRFFEPVQAACTEPACSQMFSGLGIQAEQEYPPVPRGLDLSGAQADACASTR